MKLDKHEAEAVEYLREWVAYGFPKRCDGSFPTDVLTAFRRIAHVPEHVNGRMYEDAMTAGIELDTRLSDERWTAHMWEIQQRTRTKS